MIIKDLIQQLMQSKGLCYADVKKCSNSFLKGGATPAQISSFFTAIINKKITKEEFQGLIDGINLKVKITNETKYDFYIYSFIQDNLSIALCFILSEFENLICAKFKNLYLENIDVFNSNKDVNEQKLSEKQRLLLSLSDYNKILKNILFLRSEIGFDHLLDLFELSISSVYFKHNLTILDDDQFFELNSNYDLPVIFDNKLFLVISDDGVKLVKIGDSKIEKFMPFPDWEKYNLMNFTKAILDENFINFCLKLIEQIYILNGIKHDFKKYANSGNKNLSKDIIQKYISYFEII